MNWSTIMREGNLSEDFLEEYTEYIDWTKLPEKQQLSESFIEKHWEKWDWQDISIYQTLSFPFIMKHLERLDIPYTLRNKEITNEHAGIIWDEKEKRRQWILGGNPMQYAGISLKIKESITYWSHNKTIIQVQTNNKFTYFSPSHNITIDVILHDSNDEEDYFTIWIINESGEKCVMPKLTGKQKINNEEYYILLEAVNRYLVLSENLKYPYFSRR